MKSLRDIALVFLILVLIAIGALWMAADAQDKKTQPYWVVVFRFAQTDTPGPDARIYVSVNAAQEGEAAIAAHKFLSEKLTTHAAEKLVYLEAQRKE